VCVLCLIFLLFTMRLIKKIFFYLKHCFTFIFKQFFLPFFFLRIHTLDPPKEFFSFFISRFIKQRRASSLLNKRGNEEKWKEKIKKKVKIYKVNMFICFKDNFLYFSLKKEFKKFIRFPSSNWIWKPQKKIFLRKKNLKTSLLKVPFYLDKSHRRDG